MNTTMQRLIVVLSVLILALAGVVLCQRPIMPTDAQIWVMDNVQRDRFYLFDYNNYNFDTVMTSCTLNGQNSFDAAVASDGNIWFTADFKSLQSYDPVTRNCSVSVDLSATLALVSHMSVGLGGKYIYYIGDDSIWRMDISSHASALFLAPPNDTLYFRGFGFQNGKMYSSLQYYNNTVGEQILHSYDYDMVKDEPILPPATEDAWDPSPVQYRNSFYKFKKCPRESSYFCGQTDYAPGQWVWSSLVNGSELWIAIDTYVPTYYGGSFLDYYTAPWGMMYSTTDIPGLFSYDYTTANTSVSISPFTIDNTVNNYGSFVILIEPPYVQIGDNNGVCTAEVYFNSYYWVTKYAIEMKDSTTGLFKEYYTTNDVAIDDVESRYVSMAVVCDSPTKSFRIRYEGNTDLSDNVYTMYKTVDCGCVSTPVAPVLDANVVPILECIEQVDATNFAVYLGYENLEGSPVYIPVGDSNRFSDVSDRNQPTLFGQGRTSYYPLSAFSFVTNGANINWFLSYNALPIDTQDTSVYCPASLRVELRFFYSTLDPNDQTIEAVRVAMSEYLQINQTRVKVIGFDVTPVTTKRSGLAGGNNVTLEAEIGAAQPGSPEPSAADSVTNLVQAGRNTTSANQIIDPKGADPNSKLTGVKPLSTGVEQSGSAQPGAKPRSPSSNSPNSPIGSTTSSAGRCNVLSVGKILAWMMFIVFQLM